MTSPTRASRAERGSAKGGRSPGQSEAPGYPRSPRRRRALRAGRLALATGWQAAATAGSLGLGTARVSVTERTREIGIRLAIGAQPSDVMSQFLIEAVVLSVLGGFVGIVLGSGVALLMPYVVGWTTGVAVARDHDRVRVSAVIGVFFGIYPARKASQLDPIAALRYE